MRCLVAPLLRGKERFVGMRRPLGWTERIEFCKNMRVTSVFALNQYNLLLRFEGAANRPLMTFPVNIKLVRVTANGLWSFICLTSYSRTGRMLNFGYGHTLRAMVQGNVRHFWRIIELRGLGYRLKVLNPTNIEFKLGYSHLVHYRMPKGMYCRQLGVKNRAVRIMGPDLFRVAQTVEQIKKLRAHSPYKLKGIFKRRVRPVLKEGYRQKL